MGVAPSGLTWKSARRGNKTKNERVMVPKADRRKGPATQGGPIWLVRGQKGWDGGTFGTGAGNREVAGRRCARDGSPAGAVNPKERRGKEFG